MSYISRALYFLQTIIDVQFAVRRCCAVEMQLCVGLDSNVVHVYVI